MRFELLRFMHMQQASGAAGSGDINQPAAAEPAVDWPEQGQDLPDQMGGQRTLIMPGIYTFQLPQTLAPLWHDIVAEDKRQFINGSPNPSRGQKVKRKQIRFDRNSPLVVVGSGEYDGAPMIASMSSAPRARGKADDPKTPWISDASYLLDTSLNDKSRPSDPNVLVATINKYGGKQIRLETGLTGQCRSDKVRYIRVRTLTDQALYQSSGGTKGFEDSDIQDPSGKKGCGKRYYTDAFKNPAGGYFKEIACTCGTPTPAEAAAGQQPATVVIRAFEQVERFLPPL